MGIVLTIQSTISYRENTQSTLTAKMNKTVFLLTILSVYFLSASAKSNLKCKICAGKSVYGTCRENELGRDTECEDETYVSCYKTMTVHDKIVRGCSTFDKTGCETTMKNGKKEKTCYCKDHLCNGSQVTEFSHKSLFLCATFVAIISRFT